MKGKLRQIIGMAVCCVVLCTSLTACTQGTNGGNGNDDENRTQISIALYNGGLGTEWMDEAAKRFEEKFPEYKVVWTPGKANYDAGNVYNNFDTFEFDIFFTDYFGNGTYKSYLDAGYLYDLSTIANEPLTEFGETESIYDKMLPYMKEYYSEDELYSLPWYQASYQMIYDVALFEEEKFYKDPNGNWNDGSNKSVGQDGVAGTYDDGLPAYESEFFALLDRMVQKGITPLTWAGNLDYYFTSFMTNLFAKNEGYNDFKLNYLLEGTDSDLGEITLNNAYLLHNGQTGKADALKFAKKLISNSNYYSKMTFTVAQDNTAAQDEFLSSAKTNTRIAMLVEGTWWETESKGTADAMSARYGQEYAFGTRRFGVMPTPLSDGNTYTKNTVACISATSRVWVNARTENKEGVELFIKFLHTDEILSMTTGKANTPRPYEYDMKDEDLKSMTPYAQEVYEMYRSSDVVFDEIPLHDFLVGEGSSFAGYMKVFQSSATSFTNPALSFLTDDNLTVKEYMEGAAYSKTAWEKALKEYQDRINK